MTFERENASGYLTNWAARLFARAIYRRLGVIGVSSGQLPVFFALGNGETLSQKALAEAAAIEQPTMAATLSRMERDGLIVREPDPKDRRSALVSLTPAARKKIASIKAAMQAVNAIAMDGFTQRERETFLALLRRVIASLDESLKDD
jgi:DNA-binding MarR family transcriptional regulator